MFNIHKLLKKFFYRLPASYVLMFHHIDNGNLNKKSGCILSYSSFVEILDSGLKFISVGEYVHFSKSNIEKCVVTFDDGLTDVYSVAYPELKKRNIPFTVFIITDFLDTDGYLTTEELLKLSKDPLVTIGAHGLSHEVLKGMSELRQKDELLGSKKKLELIIKKQIRFFAYSHGKYDETTLKLLKKYKEYDFAFGVAGYPTNCITHYWKYHLPRINCVNSKKKYSIKKVNRKSKLVNI